MPSLILAVLCAAAASAFVPASPALHSRRTAATQLASSAVSELSDSFDDAAVDAASATLRAVDRGANKLRVDFDTSAGDQTYTMLKQTVPMSRVYVSQLAEALCGAADAVAADDGAPAKTLALFFPDAGQAALLQRDWKVGTPEALVPPSVRLVALPRDKLAATDVAAVFVCPRAMEAESIEARLDQLAERAMPAVLINPQLVDMMTTGFGYAGRALRDRMEDGLVRAYYLRATEWGAVVRAWPLPFSQYREDAEAPGGYRLVQSYDGLPTGDELDDAIAVDDGLDPADTGGGALEGLARFIEGFQKM